MQVLLPEKMAKVESKGWPVLSGRESCGLE